MIEFRRAKVVIELITSDEPLREVQMHSTSIIWAFCEKAFCQSRTWLDRTDEGFRMTTSEHREFPKSSQNTTRTHDINPEVNFSSTGVSFPSLSLAKEMLYIFKMEATAIQSESSAKC